jgi:hypothetical protein
MLAANFLVFLVSSLTISLVDACFLQPALKSKSRFRLFRLRDELSLLAMSGEIREDSQEYMLLMSMINNSIRASQSFRVTVFVRHVVQLVRDDHIKANVTTISSIVSGSDHGEYCRIATNYFSAMHKLLDSDTRMLRFFLSLLPLPTHSTNRLVRPVLRKRTLIIQTEKALDEMSVQFKHPCVA